MFNLNKFNLFPNSPFLRIQMALSEQPNYFMKVGMTDQFQTINSYAFHEKTSEQKVDQTGESNQQQEKQSVIKTGIVDQREILMQNHQNQMNDLLLNYVKEIHSTQQNPEIIQIQDKHEIQILGTQKQFEHKTIGFDLEIGEHSDEKQIICQKQNEERPDYDESQLKNQNQIEEDFFQQELLENSVDSIHKDQCRSVKEVHSKVAKENSQNSKLGLQVLELNNPHQIINECQIKILDDGQNGQNSIQKPVQAIVSEPSTIISNKLQQTNLIQVVQHKCLESRTSSLVSPRNQKLKSNHTIIQQKSYLNPNAEKLSAKISILKQIKEKINKQNKLNLKDKPRFNLKQFRQKTLYKASGKTEQIQKQQFSQFCSEMVRNMQQEMTKQRQEWINCFRESFLQYTSNNQNFGNSISEINQFQFQSPKHGNFGKKNKPMDQSLIKINLNEDQVQRDYYSLEAIQQTGRQNIQNSIESLKPTIFRTDSEQRLVPYEDRQQQVIHDDPLALTQSQIDDLNNQTNHVKELIL